MSRHAATIESEMDRRLEAAPGPGSPNAITAREPRESAVEYLRMHDEEVACGEADGGRPHSNKWMLDVQWEDALFAVLLFREDVMEFLCGTGGSRPVRHFRERETFDDLDEMVAPLRKRFAVLDEVLGVDRTEAEMGLGRGWWTPRCAASGR